MLFSISVARGLGVEGFSDYSSGQALLILLVISFYSSLSTTIYAIKDSAHRVIVYLSIIALAPITVLIFAFSYEVATVLILLVYFLGVYTFWEEYALLTDLKLWKRLTLYSSFLKLFFGALIYIEILPLLSSIFTLFLFSFSGYVSFFLTRNFNFKNCVRLFFEYSFEKLLTFPWGNYAKTVLSNFIKSLVNNFDIFIATLVFEESVYVVSLALAKLALMMVISLLMPDIKRAIVGKLILNNVIAKLIFLYCSLLLLLFLFGYDLLVLFYGIDYAFALKAISIFMFLSPIAICFDSLNFQLDVKGFASVRLNLLVLSFFSTIGVTLVFILVVGLYEFIYVSRFLVYFMFVLIYIFRFKFLKGRL